ncbi:MAG: ccmA [Rickettsiales bacterium]|nr:ccmA [Rickettsiales bacterium]
MLTLDTLTARRGETALFKDLGITLFPGSLLTVRGPNGSGKTTLLRMIAGLSKPAAGYIRWNEVDIHTAFDEYALLIQYIGHKSAVVPQLTVRENVAFWSKLRNTSELMPAAIHYFGLEPLLDVPCHKLSAGWKQRVALARMVSCNAKLWVMDEPTTHLDRETQDQLMQMITIRCQEGGIVVIASHTELPIKGGSSLDLNTYKPHTRDD